MLNAVIRFALQNRPLIVVLRLAVLIGGGYCATRLPIDVFPDLDRPRVVVMTECLGLASEEVETLVTAPLESGLLGATGVQAVRSQSGPGLSEVNVEFDWGTNIYVARQVVQERLSSVQSSMPEGIKPAMGPISSIMGQILFIGVSRRPGPGGGQGAPVGRTPYLAEFALDPDKASIHIALWNPRGPKNKPRLEPEDWQPVPMGDTPMSLTWPGQEGNPVELRRLAGNIKNVVASIDGITPPVIESQQPIEELHIRLKPDDLAHHGIDREHAAHYVQLALQVEVVGQVIEGQRRIDLVVRLDEPFRTNYPELKRLRIDVPGKTATVLLGDIADIGPGHSPNYINRENARRRLVIRCNALGRDLGSVAGDIEKRLKERVTWPPGYFVELGGQFQSQREASIVLGGLAVVAALGMFFVLYMLYPSARIVLQVLNALPMAFVGGVLALVLTGQSVTVAALVGFISLGGIAVRNDILLITHYFHLMKHENEGFTQAMILRGSLERLAPVLMTALTAGIALVPLVWGGHQPGREILYPVATVILGGLITSTLCEFLIHPGLFRAYSGQDAELLARKKEVGKF